jgi:hypothetical protein
MNRPLMRELNNRGLSPIISNNLRTALPVSFHYYYLRPNLRIKRFFLDIAHIWDYNPKYGQMHLSLLTTFSLLTELLRE